MTDLAEIQPWDMQPGESAKAFQAFSVFRDLDPSARSVRRTAEILQKGEPMLAKWSAQHHWVERAARYDAHLDRQRRAKLEEEREAALRRQRGLGAAMQMPALEALRGQTQDGDRIVDPAKLTPTEIARLAEAGARIEMAALGFGDGGRQGQFVSAAELRSLVKSLLEISLDVVAAAAMAPAATDDGMAWQHETFTRFETFLNGGGWRSG